MLDLGDSLSVGTDPYLRPHLRSYRIQRHYDVGLHAYDAATIVAGMEPTLPSVLVVSAGTNDDPRIVSTFERAVATILSAAGRARCVVWPTIARPPAVGASYRGLNRALARAATRHPNLVLVGWAWRVRLHPRWLASGRRARQRGGLPRAGLGDRGRGHDALRVTVSDTERSRGRRRPDLSRHGGAGEAAKLACGNRCRLWNDRHVPSTFRS